MDGAAVNMVTKKQQYDVLVTKRKACRRCTGLCNPAEPALRQFDSSEIGPWSRLHGDLQAKIEPEWVQNCGSLFLRQQIEIVRPKVVVCLGAFAFHAVLRAFGQRIIELRDAVTDTRGSEILDGVRLFAADHCGNGTVNRNRDMKQQLKDWERIRNFLRPVRG